MSNILISLLNEEIKTLRKEQADITLYGFTHYCIGGHLGNGVLRFLISEKHAQKVNINSFNIYKLEKLKSIVESQKLTPENLMAYAENYIDMACRIVCSRAPLNMSDFESLFKKTQ